MNFIYLYIYNTISIAVMQSKFFNLLLVILHIRNLTSAAE